MYHHFVAYAPHPKAMEGEEGLYFYDDPSVPIECEMLVPNTTQVIAYCLSVLGYGTPSRPHPEVEISFCDNRAELEEKHPKSPKCPVIHLRKLMKEGQGTTYMAAAIHPEVLRKDDLAGLPHEAWLCEKIEDYWPEPPAEFWVHIRPL